MIAIPKLVQPGLQQTYEKQTGQYLREFGCTTNQISVDSLFEMYAELNFLYEAKMQRLKPYFNTIKENWEKAAAANLVKIYAYDDKSENAWGSVVAWRHSVSALWSQHLVSAGNPVASRAVMLAAQIDAIKDNRQSSQNWFRPDNKLPKRIFGSIEKSIGGHVASVDEYGLFEAQLANKAQQDCRYRVVECTQRHAAQVVEFARKIKGDVYVNAEELSGCDLSLNQTDQLYKRVGMRRYRRIWVVLDRFGDIVAALIGYRGPLGLNFSFLENRADLLIAPDATEVEAGNATCSLIAAASEEYADFAPGYIPVVACERGSRILENRGDQCVRKYCQSLWLRDAFQAWYDHTDSFYSRIMKRLAKRTSNAA